MNWLLMAWLWLALALEPPQHYHSPCQHLQFITHYDPLPATCSKPSKYNLAAATLTSKFPPSLHSNFTANTLVHAPQIIVLNLAAFASIITSLVNVTHTTAAIATFATVITISPSPPLSTLSPSLLFLHVLSWQSSN